MRLFVAVPVSPGIQEKLAPVISALRQTGGDFTFVSLEDAHFTLKFLGEVGEKLLPEIERRLKKLAQQYPSFSLSVSTVGVFPSLQDIRVVWVGSDSSEMIRLMKDSEMILGEVRKNEYAEEIPHVTLARVKSGRSAEKIRRVVADFQGDFGTMEVDRIVLFESTLTPKGPVYTKIKEFCLLG